jgi:hypothetical protein
MTNEKLRLAVIVTDVSPVVHAGGAAVTEVRTFDLPPEIAAYIAEKRKPAAYSQVSLAVEVTHE